MKAIVKSFYSPDIDDLWGFTPDESDCFGYLLQMIVSPEDGKGEESFDVTVATPAWLSKHHRVDDIIIGRHYLIAFEYNFQKIADFLSSYVARCLGKDWDEIANKIGRLGKWEFKDYQP